MPGRTSGSCRRSSTRASSSRFFFRSRSCGFGLDLLLPSNILCRNCFAWRQPSVFTLTQLRRWNRSPARRRPLPNPAACRSIRRRYSSTSGLAATVCDQKSKAIPFRLMRPLRSLGWGPAEDGKAGIEVTGDGHGWRIYALRRRGRRRKRTPARQNSPLSFRQCPTKFTQNFMSARSAMARGRLQAGCLFGPNPATSAAAGAW
jgi:hypothetical protein